jgi:succinate-semialdehyde dehydrogenase/glutarate-semialdehyde dehydrogenase
MVNQKAAPAGSAAAGVMGRLKRGDLFREAAYIDGEWIKAGGAGSAVAASYAVTNPVDNSQIATMPSLGEAETRRAIEAAARAFSAWRERSAKDRAAVLRRWFNLIMENQDDLAMILTIEQGKPLAEARGEVAYGAAFLEWFAEEGKRVYGDVVPAGSVRQRILVTKQPVGVCAAITPWNFPSAMITRKAGPALAAGCTMVLKPAEDTPMSAVALAVLAEEAGVPPGVFNVVTTEDPAPVGTELATNPLVRKLSFTGSTAVGKLLMRQAADTVKKLSLELGGNAPFLVFADADLDAAVKGAVTCKFRNSGQTCVCVNRIYVQDSIYEQFSARLAEAVAKLQVGDGTESGTSQGPLINEQAVLKVEEHIADAVGKGATVVCGGKRHGRGGTFFEPTILSGVTDSMVIAREETFGPVAPLFRFCDEAEAIKMANDTEFGLASYLYTRDLGRVMRVSEALEYGIVGVNEGIISTESAPFGGMKESGLGREGSKYGIDEYLELKYILLGGL